MLLGMGRGSCPQRLLLRSRWPSALAQPQGSALENSPMNLARDLPSQFLGDVGFEQWA